MHGKLVCGSLFGFYEPQQDLWSVDEPQRSAVDPLSSPFGPRNSSGKDSLPEEFGELNGLNSSDNGRDSPHKDGNSPHIAVELPTQDPGTPTICGGDSNHLAPLPGFANP